MKTITTTTGKRIFAETSAFSKKYLSLTIAEHKEIAEFHNEKAFDLRNTNKYALHVKLEKEHLAFCN